MTNGIRIKFTVLEEAIPAGKRRVHANVWGNTNGYVSGRFWKTLGATHDVGTAEAVAEFLGGAK